MKRNYRNRTFDAVTICLVLYSGHALWTFRVEAFSLVRPVCFKASSIHDVLLAYKPQAPSRLAFQPHVRQLGLNLREQMNQERPQCAVTAVRGTHEPELQQESVVLLVGASPHEEQTVLDSLRAAGTGPLAKARFVPATNLNSKLKDVLGMGPLQEEQNTLPVQGTSSLPQMETGSRMLFMFGGAAIDDTGQEAFLDQIDEADLSVLLVPAVRNPDILVSDMVRAALAEHDASYLLSVPLETHEACSWDPSVCKVTMNLEIDGAIVETRAPGKQNTEERWDAGRVCVLDNFFGEQERAALLDELVPKGWDLSETPPETHWERSLSDIPGLPATLGLRPAVLHQLCESKSEAILEVQSRLARLYPDYVVSRMPEAVLGEDITPLVANAPLAGETFSWHIDADPNMLPPSPWRDRHGCFINREPGWSSLRQQFLRLRVALGEKPSEAMTVVGGHRHPACGGILWVCISLRHGSEWGKPLFVSALLYLNPEWPESWDAETLFLDPKTGTGVFVRPRPGRLVLMDQDVSHRVSAPSLLAGRTARYSLVWKLVLHPREGTDAFHEPNIARPEWGAPTKFGSARRD